MYKANYILILIFSMLLFPFLSNGRSFYAYDGLNTSKGKSISQNELSISLNSKPIKLNEQSISVNNQSISANGQSFYAYDGLNTLKGKSISQNELSVSLNSEPIKLNEQSISVNNQSISNEKVLDDQAKRRKFDYYYYEALNSKVQGKYDVALDLFNHCYALDSTNASVLVELGTFYTVLNEKNRALDFYRKSVKYDPTNYYYNMLLAGLSREMGMKQEVVDIFEFLLKEYPNKVELNMQLAQAYADNGDLQMAINALNELENSLGVSESITLNKYQLYSTLNQKDKAYNEIQQIIEKNPGDPRYLILIGDLYLQDGNSDKALEYYKEVNKINPDYPNLILSMINFYEKTGEKVKAEDELRKAITNIKIDVEVKMGLLTRYIDILQQNKRDTKSVNPLFQTLFEQHPHNTELNLIYGNVLLLQKNNNGAMQQFQIFSDANPTDPMGYEQMLRLVLTEEDSLARVEEISTKALKFIPDAPQFYYYLGGVKYQQENYKEALAIFEEGLQKSEFNNPAMESGFYGQIGDLNYFLGRKEEAFKNYEKALQLNPGNLPTLNNYSYYLTLEKRDLNKAEQMSSITVKAEPTNPTYLDTYGWVLFEQGAYTLSKIYIENAIKYSETEPSAEVYEHYGDILSKTGEIDKARVQWKKAQELGNDSKVLKKKIKTGVYSEK